MATRSMIAFENGDEIWAIYCHNDGYPEHNGKILCEYYNTIEDVSDLLALGDLSLLGKNLGEKQNFDQPTSYNWCLAYGRDRGEKDTEAQKFETLDEAVDYYHDCDYFYMFDGREWHYKAFNTMWNPLEEGLKKNA